MTVHSTFPKAVFKLGIQVLQSAELCVYVSCASVVSYAISNFNTLNVLIRQIQSNGGMFDEQTAIQ